jgi:hypothetical protein
VLSKHDIQHILALIMDEPFLPYREIERRMQLTYCNQTIYSALKSSSYRHWLAQKRPKLDAEHAKKQYEFACKYTDWDFNQWSKVIFTNKCSIELGSGKRRLWVFQLNRLRKKWKKKFI